MAIERAPLQTFYDHYDKRRKVRLLKEGNELVWNQETKYTKPNEDDHVPEKQHFYNWQCVSLIRTNGTPLDLLIRDPHDIMVLINVV